MSKKEAPIELPASLPSVETYSGLAIQRTNVKMNKISKKMRDVRKLVDAVEGEVFAEEITKILYPEWEEMTLEDFENKTWYVEEKLLPLLSQSPDDVYQEVLEEEQAKLLPIEKAKKKFVW